jgi:sensor histidine kinase YesM
VVKSEKCIKQAVTMQLQNGQNMDKTIKTYISVLKAEIEHLKSKIEPHDTGHLYTTISTLEHRIKELESGSKG